MRHHDTIATLLQRGLALQEQGQPAPAVRCYQDVLSVDPHNPDALHLLGLIAHDCGDQLAAAELIEAAIVSATPHTPAEMYANLGPVYRALGKWSDCELMLQEALRLKPELLEARANLILHYDTQLEDPARLLEIRKEYSQQLDHIHLPITNNRNKHRPLRIGYLSGNYTLHSAAFSFQDIVTKHSPDYHAYLLSTQKKDDAFTPYFKDGLAEWHDIASLDDSELANYIQKLRIDILVDLAGHTPGGRLGVFARKPAPIQLTGWGYALGTGLPEMDYFITDQMHCPPRLAPQALVERPLYLPAFMPHSASPALPGWRARPDRPYTFGYFGNPRKLSDVCLGLFGDVLRAVPGADIVFKYAGFPLAWTQEWVLRKLAVDPARVTFRGNTPQAGHLASYYFIDCALDSYPHGGGVTTLEALLCGVPVITLLGNTLASRTGAAILTAIDCAEWITLSPEHFVHEAVSMAARDYYTPCGEELTASVLRSPICQVDTYRAALEMTYRDLWYAWAGNEKRPPATSS